MPTHPTGLFDIDNTVLNMNPNHNSPVFNHALIDAFRELGIRDVFAFTNMDLKTLDSEHYHLLKSKPERLIPLTRAEILEQITARGFNIHGVVTPIDIAYIGENGKPGLSSFYDELYKPQAARFVSGEINSENCYEDTAFDASLKKLTLTKKELHTGLEQFYESKGIKAEKQKNIEQALNIKGMLFEFFQTHKPAWVGKTIYADDEASCLESVKLIASKTDPQCVMTLFINREDHPFDKENYHKMKEAYKAQIIENLSAEEKAYLKEAKRQWDIEDYTKQYSAFINELKEVVPEQWQKYITTSPDEMHSLAANQQDSKTMAMFNLTKQLSLYNKAITGGQLSFEDAKSELKLTIETVIEKAGKKSLGNRLGFFTSKTADRLQEFIDKHYSKPAVNEATI